MEDTNKNDAAILVNATQPIEPKVTVKTVRTPKATTSAVRKTAAAKPVEKIDVEKAEIIETIEVAPVQSDHDSDVSIKEIMTDKEHKKLRKKFNKIKKNEKSKRDKAKKKVKKAKKKAKNKAKKKKEQAKKAAKKKASSKKKSSKKKKK